MAFTKEEKDWRQKYTNQRNNAVNKRNIEWKFDFKEWMKWWDDSGVKHLRGNKKGQYVMARYNDTGQYSYWNCRPLTVEANVSECFKGKPQSEEHKKSRGGKRSAETIQKMFDN